MEAQKFIIRYGCNDFMFEGTVLELTSIVWTLEKLTPVLFSTTSETYKEPVLRKKLLIYSARKEVDADTNSTNTIYVIDK